MTGVLYVVAATAVVAVVIPAAIVVVDLALEMILTAWDAVFGWIESWL